MGAKIYFVWAVLVLGVLGVAEYRGMSFTQTVSAKGNPVSIRSNPGAYRPSYYQPGRTLRGK